MIVEVIMYAINPGNRRNMKQGVVSKRLFYKSIAITGQDDAVVANAR